MGKSYGKPKKINLWLEQLGQLLSGTPQDSSSNSVHKWTPEPTDISDPLFDQDFDEFMESLDNLKPYDNLEDWLDNIDVFMDAMSHSPHIADILWEEAKLKKQGETSKTPEKPSESIFNKPWTKEPEGLIPTQS